MTCVYHLSCAKLCSMYLFFSFPTNDKSIPDGINIFRINNQYSNMKSKIFFTFKLISGK